MTEAPRWLLNEPHYLNCRELPDGTRCEWEHRETARETGRTVRKLYSVPILLDPKDPADFNYRELGQIIVAHEGASNLARDIIFDGNPTPGMEPLNEAAQAITDSLRQKWDHPIDALPVNGGMNPNEQAFMEQMMKAFEKVIGNQSPTLPNGVVAREDYDELKARLDKFEAMLAAQNKATPPAERRV